jgi:hypothetical protein
LICDAFDDQKSIDVSTYAVNKNDENIYIYYETSLFLNILGISHIQNRKTAARTAVRKAVKKAVKKR